MLSNPNTKAVIINNILTHSFIVNEIKTMPAFNCESERVKEL